MKTRKEILETLNSVLEKEDLNEIRGGGIDREVAKVIDTLERSVDTLDILSRLANGTFKKKGKDWNIEKESKKLSSTLDDVYDTMNDILYELDKIKEKD